MMLYSAWERDQQESFEESQWKRCKARIGYKRVLRFGRTYELQSADRPLLGWITESKHKSLASSLYALAMSVTEADQKYQQLIDEANAQESESAA